MPLFKDNEDLDSTILILIGGLLALIIIIGLLFIHYKSKSDKPLLTEAIIMALINIPNTCISYSVGNKNGIMKGMAKLNEHRIAETGKSKNTDSSNKNKGRKSRTFR